MGEVDEVFGVLWVCWTVGAGEGCEWGSLVDSALVGMWFVSSWWFVGVGRRGRELLFVALLRRVWLFVLIGMRVGACADELRLMVVGIGWIVAGGSGGASRKRKKEIPYKRACEGYRVHGGYTVIFLNPIPGGKLTN